MAKIRKRTRYVIEHNEREFEVEHEPCGHEDPIIRELPNGKLVIGYLSDDHSPHNPREDDQLGVMVCWHRRYNLGDKHDHKDPDALWASLLGEEYEKLDEQLNAELEAWINSQPGVRYGDKAYLERCDQAVREMRQKVRDRLVAKGYVILPLYLFDHSGITMSTGPFSCPWDSGQVGWIYAGPEEAKKVGAPLDSLERQLKAEVEEYDRYLRGECYGVCVEVFDAHGEQIEEEACWGYLGSDWAKEELEGQVNATTEQHGE